MSFKKICDVCYEEAGNRVTDKMRPICDLCYEDVQKYQSTEVPLEYRCTVGESDELGDLKKCREYDRILRNYLEDIKKKEGSIKNFQEDLEIHCLLYPQVEKIGEKKVEISTEDLQSEKDTLERTHNLQKLSCETQSAKQLRKVESFLNCYVPRILDLALPLPRGSQRDVFDKYLLSLNRSLYKTTFDDKVVYSDLYKLYQFKKDTKGQVISEVIFEVPSNQVISHVSRYAIWVRPQGQIKYLLYDKSFKLVAEFESALEKEPEYIPASSNKPALVILSDYNGVLGYRIENGQLVEIWKHRLSLRSHSLFSSSLIGLTSNKIIIFDVDTGSIMWEKNFRVTDRDIFNQGINMTDGRIHTVKLNVKGDIVYSVHGLLGGKSTVTIPRQSLSPILLPGSETGYKVWLPFITINPNTGKVYIFLK